MMQQLTHSSTVVAHKKIITDLLFLSAYHKYEKHKKYIDPAKNKWV